VERPAPVGGRHRCLDAAPVATVPSGDTGRREVRGVGNGGEPDGGEPDSGERHGTGGPSDLPLRPNRVTGRPMPPPAPGTDGPRVFEQPRRPRPAPPGRGPLFVGRSGFCGRPIVTAAALVVVVAAVVLVLAGGSTPGWFVAALLAAAAVVLVRVVAATYLAAGADWLADERSWVDLYDLVAVEGASRRRLSLTDGEGRRVTVGVGRLRAIPALWDLVHLGVRWSRARNVVHVDGAAAAVLGDDGPSSS
jgi:hypothetical protein